MARRGWCAGEKQSQGQNGVFSFLLFLFFIFSFFLFPLFFLPPPLHHVTALQSIVHRRVCQGGTDGWTPTASPLAALKRRLASGRGDPCPEETAGDTLVHAVDTLSLHTLRVSASLRASCTPPRGQASPDCFAVSWWLSRASESSVQTGSSRRWVWEQEWRSRPRLCPYGRCAVASVSSDKLALGVAVRVPFLAEPGLGWTVTVLFWKPRFRSSLLFPS